MKNFIINLILCVVLTTGLSASSGPEMSLTMLKTDAIEIALDNIGQRGLFKLADFNKLENNLEFSTEKEIRYIQIFNENNNLEFQLQVGSKKIRISKNILDKGVYKLGFIVKGQETIEFLGVKVN